MNDLTPADLAKFIYRVPVGATIPAGTEYAWRNGMAVWLSVFGRDITQLAGEITRWTAEPIPASESLAEKARRLGGDYPGDSWGRQLASIVAELAERIEAKP